MTKRKHIEEVRMSRSELNIFLGIPDLVEYPTLAAALERAFSDQQLGDVEKSVVKIVIKS